MVKGGKIGSNIGSIWGSQSFFVIVYKRIRIEFSYHQKGLKNSLESFTDPSFHVRLTKDDRRTISQVSSKLGQLFFDSLCGHSPKRWIENISEDTGFPILTAGRRARIMSKLSNHQDGQNCSQISMIYSASLTKEDWRTIYKSSFISG